MSIVDQCPSSVKEGLPPEKPLQARDISAATGRAYWRSLDDVAQTQEFRGFVEREFPAFASELLDGTRRYFLKIMGASLALAGAALVPGCRRPDHKILPYNKDPEHVVPGKPLFYATAMPLPGGGCEGLLAETFEGRPTKLEGNPLHSYNLGKSGLLAQASILDLYDPDRDPAVFMESSDGKIAPSAFEKFSSWSTGHFAGFDATKGAKLAFLMDKTTSPSRDALRDRIRNRWPNAKWYVYHACDDEQGAEGSRIAFGAEHRPVYNLENARTIVSLDRDFLGIEGGIEESRGFAAGRFRKGAKASDAQMSRIYVVESSMTMTGGQADHRLPMRPTAIPGFAAALARAIFARIGGPSAGALNSAIGAIKPAEGAEVETWVDAVSEELITNRTASVVMAGASQPAAVHALVHAINAALGNAGKTVEYYAVKSDAAVASSASIAALTRDLNAGAVDTLVVVGGNPAFDAPADLAFASAMSKAANRVYLGEPNETAEATCAGQGGWYLPVAHFLESWNDVESWDGTYSVVQPMIEPLFHGVNDLKLLATIGGAPSTDPYEIVRETVSARIKQPKLAADGKSTNSGFEKAWRRALHDGVLPGTGGRAGRVNLAVDLGRVSMALSSLSSMTAASGVDVVFVASAKVHDGRWANNGWLQEVPHEVHKISWDNVALISRRTAEKLGLKTSRKLSGPQYNHVQVIKVTLNGKSVDIPMLVQPGMADDTVVLTLGYGRRQCGRIGKDTGFDVYPIRTSSAMSVATGASVGASDKPAYLIANTQDHWTMEGRGILREVDLDAWKKHGDSFDHTTDPYGHQRDLNFAERLGVESHMPLNRSMYTNKQMAPHTYYETNPDGSPKRDASGNIIGRLNKYGRRVQQWGMTIDLTTCTGCGTCTVACQAENNIPIVGKMEVAKGREMHWIRVDRYYASDTHADEFGYDLSKDDRPDMLVQPIACVHCESAPCEVVCPVNATVHGDEGLNEMAYNRCIGTRYCNNNCPYKVRRFNWFDYATKQYKGGFGQVAAALEGEVPEGLVPSNQNFIPPRLRPYKAEVGQMQYNPHVTVRSRGVMEKCTYCIQRINAARVETKLHDLPYIPDGYFQTACQQACPTNAIVFGDIYDNESNNGAGSLAKQSRNDARSYAVLAYIATNPRTLHMLRVRNPNPKLRKPVEDPFHHGHDEHHEGGEPHAPEHGGDQHHARAGVISLPVLPSRVGALA